MNTLNRRSSHRAKSGFSLVEVALAVAIAALGIITCLGLLPEGLEMSRRTGEMAINSNILQQIIRDVENSSWTYLAAQQEANAKVKKYYNDQGSEVTTQAKDITYVAELDFGVSAYLPASNPDLALQANLIRFVIRMATTSSVSYTFEGKNPALYTTFFHMVARTEPSIPQT